MVSEIVMSVLSDNTNRRITIQEAVAQTEEKAKKEPKKRERKASAPKEKKAKAESKVPASSPSPASIPSAPASAPATGNADTFVGQPCPVCGKGLKGSKLFNFDWWKFEKNFANPVVWADLAFLRLFCEVKPRAATRSQCVGLCRPP